MACTLYSSNPEFSGELEPQWQVSNISFWNYSLSLHFEFRTVLTLTDALNTIMTEDLQIPEIFQNITKYVVLGVTVAVTQKPGIQYCDVAVGNCFSLISTHKYCIAKAK